MLNTTINQSEIARRAGVSRATVSFVLNDRLRSRVNAKTCEKVFEIVRESGYRPHRYAQMMRKGKSGTIGMIHWSSWVQTALQRTFFTAREIHESGYQVLTAEVPSYREGLITACDMMIDARVEGVIFDGAAPDYVLPQLKRLRKAGIPIVTIGSDRVSGIPHVATDSRQGLQEMTNHVIQLGYRRLSMFAPEYAKLQNGYLNFSISERVEGFLEAVAEAGLTDTEVVYQAAALAPDELCEPGRLAALKMLKRRKHPEVFLCCSDDWAVGAFKACMDAGLNVPKDIAITGFDDARIGKYTPAVLTTVSQPLEAVAKKAVEILLTMARGEKSSTSNKLVKLPCKLVIRESCGSVRSGD
ncbi:MAG: LacI family DNA-binding transcriptional regulator [Chthoniobacterales bacterium]